MTVYAAPRGKGYLPVIKDHKGSLILVFDGRVCVYSSSTTTTGRKYITVTTILDDIFE